jgi:lysophospholipase L1-like esterase
MEPSKMAEIIKNPEIKEVLGTMMFKYFEEQKSNRIRIFKFLNQNVKKGQILFVGSSLMELFPINEMQQTAAIDHTIYNRGVCGFKTMELLAAMDECIFDLEPSKIFINIGSNDIGNNDTTGYKKENLLVNYNKIMDQIQNRLPGCEVYVMAYYPINAKADFGLDKDQMEDMYKTRTNENIKEANDAIEELAEKHGFNFINVNEGLTDMEGNLKKEYSMEGLHMWPNAYSIILGNMKKYLQ